MTEIPLTPGQIPFLLETVGSRTQPIVQISCLDHSGTELSEVKRAWTAVLHHFDVLRLGFNRNPSGPPLPFIAAAPDLKWNADTNAVASPSSPETWAAFLSADREQAFNIDQPPLWRVTAWQLSPTAIRWVWSFHHALLDGRSFALILTAYVAALGQQPLPPVSQNAAQIATALQAKRLASHRDGRAPAHWQKYFSDPPEPVTPSQPIHYSPRSASAPPRHFQSAIELSVAEHDTLVRLVQESAITIGTVVLGVWGLALSALVDSPDVVFGLTRACRHLPDGEAKSAAGLFINTVPFRTTLDRSTSFVTWLQSLRDQQLSLRDAELDDNSAIRQAVPDLASPFYASTVVLENSAQADDLNERWQNSHQMEFALTQAPPPVPLVLTGQINPQLRLEVITSAEHFDQSFTHSIASTCLTLLRHFLSDQDSSLGSIPLVPPEAEAALRRQLTGPVLTVPEHELLHHGFENSARNFPANIAVHEDSKSVTYRELDEHASRLAHHLHQLGIGPDSLCAIALPRSARLLAAILGVLKSGSANLMLDAGFPIPRLVRLIEQARPKVVLCDAQFAQDLKSAGCNVPCIDPAQLPPSTHPGGPAPSSPAQPHHLAYAIFTSGSTGQPKLVGVEHRQAVSLFAHAVTQIITADAVRLVPFIDSPAFDSFIHQVFSCLNQAGCLVAIAEPARMGASPFFDRFTAIGSAPNQLNHLLQSHGFPPSVRFVATGGEVIQSALIKALSERPSVQRVVNFYGPTETTMYCTAQILFDRDQSTTPRPTAFTSRHGRNIGKPISNVTAEIVSPLGQMLPAGWPGELWISGALVSRGYLLDTANPFSAFEPAPAPRRYHTGDRVVLTPEGSIQFEGRRDRQIKVRGVRIDPAEVTARLREYPGIEAAYVDLHRAAGPNALLAAWVVGPPDLDLNALRQFTGGQLPLAAVPSLWSVLTEMPLTHTGKIDHRRLPSPIQPVDDVAPEDLTPTEHRLLRLWQDRLGIPAPALHTDFFATGGDSLVATQWIAAIETEFDLRLPVGILNQSASIRELGKWIDQKSSAAAPATPASLVTIVPLHETGPGLPLLIVPGGTGEDAQFFKFKALAQNLADQRPVYWLSRSLPESVEAASDPAIIDRYVAATTAAITARFGQTRVALFGYCLGGTTAWLINQAFEKQHQYQIELIMLDSLLLNEFEDKEAYEKRFGIFLAYHAAWFDAYPTAKERWLKLPLWLGRTLVGKLAGAAAHQKPAVIEYAATLNPIEIALGDLLRTRAFEGHTDRDICLLRSDRSTRFFHAKRWRSLTTGKIRFFHFSKIGHANILTKAATDIAATINAYLSGK